MTYTNELYHHGVKGMRWGVRRYRNEDGSLTEAGKKKYRARDQEHVRNILGGTIRDYEKTQRQEQKRDKQFTKAEKQRSLGRIERATRIENKANARFEKARARFNKETKKRIDRLSDVVVRHGKLSTERMLVDAVFSHSMVFDHYEQGGLMEVYTPDANKVRRYAVIAQSLLDDSSEALSERRG